MNVLLLDIICYFSLDRKVTQRSRKSNFADDLTILMYYTTQSRLSKLLKQPLFLKII